MHLFVSPHLDDAALSCGATIASLTRLGHQAVLLTVFAGRDKHRTLAPYAARYHAKCGLADFWTRRWEDVQACTILGAGQVHLQFSEVLYRRDQHGRPRISSRDDLFSPLTDDDRLVVADVGAELRRWLLRLRPITVYGPLGMGSHVDHVITSVALQRAVAKLDGEAPPRLLLYEEMPYSVWPDSPTVFTRLHATATPVVRQVTDEDWQRKLMAIDAYQSQLTSVWKDQNWRLALGHHARQVTKGSLGERTWAPSDPLRPPLGATSESAEIS
jgi:LmbE family N-acetylglucosaminyl deacetylase